MQHCFLPVRECDGTHMQNRCYNGICVVLTAIDGDGHNLPLAMGFIQKETSDNFAWFFTNCIAAGIRLADVPVFTDRGKQLNAQQLLQKNGLQLHLKFCSLHIVFNATDRFRLDEEEQNLARSLIFKLQAVRLRVQYESVIAEIRQALPRSISVGNKKEEFLSDYLRKIHLTSWTRLGNYFLLPSEQAWLVTEWRNITAYGSPLPLLGVRPTSAIEEENHAFIWSVTRDCTPPDADVAFYQRMADQIEQ
jgi:hypothetical protein